MSDTKKRTRIPRTAEERREVMMQCAAAFCADDALHGEALVMLAGANVLSVCSTRGAWRGFMRAVLCHVPMLEVLK